MSQRLWRSLLLPVLISAAVTACQAQSPTVKDFLSVQVSDRNPDCKVINHTWGKTELCESPQRIIVLDPHALDLLLSLDLQPIGYAEDSRAVMGEPALGKRVNGVKYLGDRLTEPPLHVGTWQTPSLETMLKLEPDLILGGYLEESQYKQFSQIAPTLLPLDGWMSPDQWQENLLLLGQALNREDTAQQVIDAYQQTIDTARADVIQKIEYRDVLLLSMTGLDYIGVFDDDSFAGSILNDLGFNLVIPDHQVATYGEIVISTEILPQLEPDLIIVMASGDSRVDQVKQVWAQNPVLRSLPAYQANQVYFVDYQLWSRIQGAIAAELIIAQVRDMLL